MARSTPVTLGRRRHAHEWVSFDDPHEARTWVFDVTFLLSRWSCIFGRGCQGVLTGPAEELVQGCCSYGAHLVDEDDEVDVVAAAARLTGAQWQHKAKSRRNGVVLTDEVGARVTRQVDGACIFLNRPGFARGPGCALHVGALDAGERPLDWKPDVCWQLPLRREDEVHGERVTSTVRQWDRSHWGEGGAEFHWWCTEAPEAFSSAAPVYLSLQEELIELTTADAYALVAAHCESRLARAKPLAHPATRKR